MAAERDEISFGTLVLHDTGSEFELAYDFVVSIGDGTTLTAPAGTATDGASIPRFFWRVIGSPFVGLYRRATVVHDVYCVTRSEPHEAVHEMFLEAMRSDGVSASKASAMYGADDSFGPKWDVDGYDVATDDPLDDDDYFSQG